MSQPLIVQAEYSFKGGNNDELCFKKGDLITVTQREEGGWWEGTLNDKTGWFPSNYVNEYKAPLPITETIRPPEEIQEYRSVVLKDLLDSERAHVAEVQGLLENFLEPLQQTQILTPDEYAQLMCNFVEVVRTHEELLKQMEECNDRVGKLFLTKAPHMKQVHQAYCASHPKAIVILDKHKDELEKYMERQGAASPGLLVLTTGLSKPFRRLDKYSAMLQELERHMESSHPDRGDTQRSVAVYKDIAAACSATRRQKELELQVLTGPVRGWQGQQLSSLGDIIHMGSVAVGPDHRDRYFVLFPQTLLILSVSQRMSAFIYEGKLPLTGIIVNRLEDSDTVKNAFEISGPLIERIVAVCQGPNEATKWVELLNSANPSMPIGIKRQLSNLSNTSMSSGHAPQPPPHNPHILDPRGYSTRFSLCAYYAAPPCKPYCITLPPNNYPPTAPYAKLTAHFAKLVKAGRLKSNLVKMLLYPQARQSIDLKEIALRKKRAQKSIAAHGSKDELHQALVDCSNSSERSELERQNAFELPTDSESDDADDDYERYTDCDSNPFEYIKFHTNRRDSSIDEVTLEPKQRRHRSSINLIKLDTDSGEDHPVALQKESLIIGSKAMQALARKSTDSIIIHTTTAHLDLSCSGGITSCVEEEEEDRELTENRARKGLLHNQASQASHGSSVFCERFGGAYVACENLANMSDETKIKLNKQETEESPAERHSMPNLFVGNRFNRSSKTAVYVPTWQDRKEPYNLSVDALKRERESCASDNSTDEYRGGGGDDGDDDDDGDGDDDDVTHSSTLDLPAACLTAPDKLQAELLYNFDESCLERQTISADYEDIISPPTMFKPQFLFNQNAPSAQQQQQGHKNATETSDQVDGAEDAPFLNASQSTTELYIEPQRSSAGSDKNKQSRSNSLRRCISYQFVQMSNAHDADGSGGSGSNESHKNSDNPTKGHIQRNIPMERMHRQQSQQRKDPNAATSTKCKCCESSQCPSPRSSDSGMAGSCTITSPDPPLVNDIHTYINFDTNAGEGHIMPPPPPMPVTTTTDSNTLNDLTTRYDICGMFRAKFLTPEATQDITDNNTGSCDEAPQHLHQQYSLPNMDTTTTKDGAPNTTIATAELQVSPSSTTINSIASHSSHQMLTGSQPNMQFSSSFDDLDSRASASATATNPDGPLFRSGMYAHWWKKEKLPTEVVRGIAKALRTPQLSSRDSRCSMCSSCVSCMSGGGSGFSEGTAYSSLCRECVCFCRSGSSASAQCDTSTTTTTSTAHCPLCSASVDEEGSTTTDMRGATPTVESARMSPPANLGMLASSQRTNSQNPTQAAAAAASMAQSLSHPSQHKRSLSFNHHLSYNQYTPTQPPPPHHHLRQQQQNQQNHPVAPNHKSNLVPTSSNISKSQHQAAGNTNARIGSTKANWSIRNLRPAPPLRPNLLNATTQSGSGSGGGSGSASGSGSANALASYCSGRRVQPTFEEDVLVLRVIEGYCAAYQNTTRNTIHSALQPWTPCLPIRGGKLQTSKAFSTSNPQLPQLCATGVPFPGNSGVTNQQNSTNSLNSSYIWREASPNNFNLYSSSVSSLNTGATAIVAGSGGGGGGGYRYSLSGSSNAGAGPSSLPIYERALSEERATRKSLNRMKSGFGSGYDNIFMTPLLPRKNKPSPKMVKNSYQTHQRSPVRQRSDSEQRLDATPLTITEQESPHLSQQQQRERANQQQRSQAPGLYDRRLNRSFETTVSHRYAGYGGGYMMSGYGPASGYKVTPLRRSTPHLAAGGEDVIDDGDCGARVCDGHRGGCGAALLGNGNNVGKCDAVANGGGGSDGDSSQRHSGSWCCGNFVMKQWRKMNNY